ncbi:MAG TPA: divalent-cation tolerance protein CutA [Caulifigura sp.]|nr:divalent-cation tolerance protein CutA [Caulifigura sp.]
MNAALVYVTAPNREEALRIGRALVTEALAACANVLDGMTSLYHWNGEIQTESEALLLLKTRSELTTLVVKRVQELHPYDVPAIVVLPIEGGSNLFLSWIGEETSAAL